MSSSCSAVVVSPEVVLREKGGLLSEPRDPETCARNLARLASEPALRETYGRAALHRVNTAFSADRMARQTLAVYDELLRPGAAVPSAADRTHI